MRSLAATAVLMLISQLHQQALADRNNGSYNVECDDQEDRYDDRLDAVRFHNIYRSDVAIGESIRGQAIPPEAGNMEQMLYSCELEKEADAHIASCPSELPSAPLEKLEYNVDIVKEVDRNTALRTAIFHWATTYQTLDGWECIVPFMKSRSAWPFYTMMNAKTNRMGCAVKKCYLKYYISCFYGEKLAEHGKPIYYKDEPPCSQCPDGTTCKLSEANSLLCREEGISLLKYKRPFFDSSRRKSLIDRNKSVWLNVNNHIAMSRFAVLILAAYVHAQKQGDFERRRNIDCDDQKALYDVRRDAVNVHNLYRSCVAKEECIKGQEVPPQAANMREMLYSCELEQKAEKLIASCPAKLPAPLKRLEYNVDIVKGVDEESALKAALFRWFTTYQTIKGWQCMAPSNKSPSAWPFYMMMNAETSHLGCATKKCGLKFYISCYYGDKLATNGVAIYHKGKPCSECPEGTQCGQSDGLCDSLFYSK